jgi:glycosyltransferase involved in cell wall biosynthesis
MTSGPPRVLVAIPAYNEAPTIAAVVARLRVEAPEFDLLVVDDGSRDGTGAVLREIGVAHATHLCNLGYGRAMQTAIKYAQVREYDALITFDADGQHQASDLSRVYRAFVDGRYDLLIGSRFVESRHYDSEPFVRRTGMRVFSLFIRVLTGQQVFDTSSGLKVIGRPAFDVLTSRPFVDFHAEAILYLIEDRRRVGESPITVEPRRHGESMYDAFSAIKYPMKVVFLLIVGVIDARVFRRQPHA